jgi:hypothetical protein
MLTWISGGKSDHPLDDKDARRSLRTDLARMTPVMALDQVASFLDEIKTAQNLRPKEALAIMDLLDRSSESLRRELQLEYLAQRDRLTKFQENRLWTAGYNHWRQLADGYRFCLGKYQVGAVGASALKPHLSRIICRTLRACAMQLKWALSRYGPIEQRLWEELGEVYRLSLSLQIAQVQCTVFPDISSTPEREFLRAAMLAVSAPDTLSPLQMEIAWRVIDQVAAGFNIGERASAGMFYLLQLSGTRGPGRFATDRKLGSDTRYFGPGSSLSQVAQAIRFIDHHHTLPPGSALGDEFDLALVHATLRHLLRYWSPALPERRDRRRRHTERVTVVHAFDEVAAAVGGLFLESPFVSNEEEWIIENESKDGFGAFVEAPLGSWLRIGALIGLRRDEGASWGAAIVRRVSIDERGNRYVGIEVLAHGGTAVTVIAASMSAKGSAIPAHGELCVLLPSSDARGAEAFLLMRPGLFSPAQRLLMSAYDRMYALSPVVLAEQSTEFDLGRYRITAKLDDV